MNYRLAWPLLVIPGLLVSSCSLPYYWQAVGGQLELLRKRTPIEDILASPGADPNLQSTLRYVGELRQFASNQLELPDNDSYTSYADLERSYVVWNVVAAEEFSIEPISWCFPFAGCVAYRGFFDRARAEEYQAELVAEGLDTYSGGSGAYSTLGYFSDPVLNTMLGGGRESIASVLFHELAHQKLYFKNDSELSEAFASVIEEHGTERWLRDHGDFAALEAYRTRLQRRSEFAGIVSRQQQRLRDVYGRAVTNDERRAAKAAAFETMRQEYSAVRAAWGDGVNYDTWFSEPLNNAALAAVATYRRWSPALRARLEKTGLSAFYIEMEALAGLDEAERNAHLDDWAAADSLTAGAPSVGR